MTEAFSLWHGDFQFERRRDRSGHLLYSYGEKVARGWLQPVRERTYPRPTIATSIIAEVAAKHGISAERLCSEDKTRLAAHARFEAMVRLHALLLPSGANRFSLSHIGWLLGGRDHSTVRSGLRRWAENQAKSDAKREAEAA
jgi:chromosomal replication initiation ATPase DnaA